MFTFIQVDEICSYLPQKVFGFGFFNKIVSLYINSPSDFFRHCSHSKVHTLQIDLKVADFQDSVFFVSMFRKICLQTSTSAIFKKLFRSFRTNFSEE